MGVRVRVGVTAGRVLDLVAAAVLDGEGAACGRAMLTRAHSSLLVTTSAYTVAVPDADTGAVQPSVAEVFRADDVCVAPPAHGDAITCESEPVDVTEPSMVPVKPAGAVAPGNTPATKPLNGCGCQGMEGWGVGRK